MRESKARKKMDYCDSDDVKGPLQIDLAETKFDRLLKPDFLAVYIGAESEAFMGRIFE
jgi:hypothetical protein